MLMELLFFFCTMIVLDHFFLTTEIQYLCFAWRVRVAVVLVDDDRVPYLESSRAPLALPCLDASSVRRPM